MIIVIFNNHITIVKMILSYMHKIIMTLKIPPIEILLVENNTHLKYHLCVILEIKSKLGFKSLDNLWLFVDLLVRITSIKSIKHTPRLGRCCLRAISTHFQCASDRCTALPDQQSISI